MEYRFNEVLDASRIEDAMISMAKEIYKIGSPLAIIAILKGGAYAAYGVLKLLNAMALEDLGVFDVVIGHIGLESYGNGTKSSGEVKLMTPLDLSRKCIKNRHVVIIDDCIETGKTFDEAWKIVRGYNPLSMQTAVLVDKSILRLQTGAHRPEIVGYTYSGNGFLVGCGMGAGERYRELSGLYELEEV
jgi:hypoxanthine phosphoribosyltransferase